MLKGYGSNHSCETSQELLPEPCCQAESLSFIPLQSNVLRVKYIVLKATRKVTNHAKIQCLR